MTATKLVGPLEDLKTGTGTIIAEKGEVTVGYVRPKQPLFILGPKGMEFVLVDGTYAEIVPEAKPADQSWQQGGIDKLTGLTETQREKLAHGNILTLGDLQDRMTKDGLHWFDDIAGIGREAATKVEDLFNDFVSKVA